MKQSNQQLTDWHPADIKAALEKKDTNLAILGRDNGYAPRSAYDVLRRRWAAMERIVADALGLHPSEIWPSRYDGDTGLPLRARAA